MPNKQKTYKSVSCLGKFLILFEVITILALLCYDVYLRDLYSYYRSPISVAEGLIKEDDPISAIRYLSREIKTNPEARSLMKKSMGRIISRFSYDAVPFICINDLEAAWWLNISKPYTLEFSGYEIAQKFLHNSKDLGRVKFWMLIASNYGDKRATLWLLEHQGIEVKPAIYCVK